MKKALGRLHVITGNRLTLTDALLFAACICFSIMASCDAWAADYPVASAPGWTTNAFIYALPNASAPVTIKIPQYLTGDREVTIEPMGVVVVPLTVPNGFGIVTIPDTVGAFVQPKYDGATHSSYTLGGISPTKAGKYVPILNDGSTLTVVTTLCSAVTPLTITPRDSHGQAGRHEYATCTPPASQYPVEQYVAGGSLDVNVGNLPFDNGSGWGPLYVIVTVGKPDRDAFVVGAH